MTGGIGNVRDELLRLLTELYNGLEVVAGSFDEVKEVERLRGIVESYTGVKAKLIETPLISWRFKWASLDPKPEVLAIAPYVESYSVRAPWFKVDGDPSKPRSWRGFPEGRIAIVREPGNPDDIKASVLNAAEAGAQAVIVESPNAPRKIVTNGYWGYNFNVGAPTPIPVVVVEEGYSSKLTLGEEVSVEVEATTVDSTGYTIALDLPGSSEDITIIGAHHDRWYGGFLDNILGIAQAMVTSKLLNSLALSTRLLIFTAEEHGAPGYASWYWAWGSRFYASQLLKLNLVRDIRVAVNYDMAGVEPLRISGSPQYTGLVEASERCCECPECDSFSFAIVGIPTLCVHTLWSPSVRSVYHTPLDEPRVADLDAASRAVEIIVRAISKGPSWGYFEKLLLESLGWGPLEARRVLEVLVSLAKRAGWDDVYRGLARIALKSIHYGSYRLDEVELEAVWFPEVVVYRRLLEDMNRGVIPHQVWITGDERVLYATRGPNGKPLPVRELARQFRANMDTLWDKIVELQRELLR